MFAIPVASLFMFLPVLLFFFSLSTINCLQCYTGFNYLAGQSVGTETETCSLPTDYCYNATAGVTTFAEVKMAGCSTTLCFVSRLPFILSTAHFRSRRTSVSPRIFKAAISSFAVVTREICAIPSIRLV